MPSVEDGYKKYIIRDSVHGYVEMGSPIVKEVIDTPFFQRLLRIQQTNLSVLYPSATHTRFEHSIGVFYLGKFLFNTICKNSTVITEKTFKDKYRNTFLLACLLHDIGHAPLSHIGEAFFEKDELLRALEAKGISLKSTKPAEHEIMSCLVALEVFEHTLSKYNVDKELFCRMITGVEYTGNDDETAKKNILIRLLNSSFDVDKMDYIMRDSLSAGISFLTLDIYRIVHALSILEDNRTPRLAFQKVGFSVVNNIINNRNYLYYWLYGHHKVQYYSYVLKRYIRELAKNSEFGSEFKKIFSSNAIIAHNGIST
jgi:HD superfamily phosphohydrolase